MNVNDNKRTKRFQSLILILTQVKVGKFICMELVGVPAFGSDNIIERIVSSI